MKCRLNIHQLIFSLKHECKADTILGMKDWKEAQQPTGFEPITT